MSNIWLKQDLDCSTAAVAAAWALQWRIKLGCAAESGPPASMSWQWQSALVLEPLTR